MTSDKSLLSVKLRWHYATWQVAAGLHLCFQCVYKGVVQGVAASPMENTLGRSVEQASKQFCNWEVLGFVLVALLVELLNMSSALMFKKFYTLKLSNYSKILIKRVKIYRTSFSTNCWMRRFWGPSWSRSVLLLVGIWSQRFSSMLPGKSHKNQLFCSWRWGGAREEEECSFGD